MRRPFRRNSFPGKSSRFNAEKGVFLLAALWLLAMGVRFTDAPEVPEWGPPRTNDWPSDIMPFDVNAAMPPLDSVEEPTNKKQEEPEVRNPPEVTEGGSQQPEEDAKEEKEQDIRKRPGGTGGKQNGGPEPLPPRFVGTISVEDSDIYTVLADGEQYVMLSPGGGGAERYRILERGGTWLLLEDASGRRFRIPVP